MYLILFDRYSTYSNLTVIFQGHDEVKAEDASFQNEVLDEQTYQINSNNAWKEESWVDEGSSEWTPKSSVFDASVTVEELYASTQPI